ncbi:MAG: ABC transporter ATP-binding protein [Solobacterium sp.]|nr:ABC transporter ATP-binding protein [Solobacterium sp.]
MSEDRNQTTETAAFRSLDTLYKRWKEGTFGEILEDWKWIFSYSSRYKGTIVFYTFLGIFSSTLALVSGVVSKYIIDIVTGYQYEKLGILIALYVGSSIFSLVFSSLLSRVTAKLSLRINHEIQADIFDKIMDAKWLEISKYRNGDILNRFNGDVSAIANNAVSWIPNIIIAVYSFIATFVVIWHYSKLMSVLSFASAPVMLLMSRFVIRKQREYNRKTREISSKVMTFEVETFYNMDTIKSFGIAPLYGRKLREWQDKYKDIYLDFNLFSIQAKAFMSLVGRIVQFIVFGYCLYLLWTHEITYGTMTLFLTQRARMTSAFNNIISVVPSFLSASVSAHRLRELVDLPKEDHIPAEAEVSGKLSVVMEDVSFGYEENTPVFTDVQFTAEPGEIVALVGPSGQGKTTMMRLILGLVSPLQGKAGILSEDHIFTPGNADIRRYFSYVPQGNTILSGTIAENMRIVKEDATDEEIIACLKSACAWEFVERMPLGINSPVGERGKGLSEGQAQRIAIARALLRDAPVLLLDEATSALDVTTERNVLRNIMQDHQERTCIVTTHRPSVLGICQRVYGVQGGKVRELDEEESAELAMEF